MIRVTFVAILQGIYWAVTGIWPLLHMPSFLWVTGPKNDLWLVRTVAVLILAIGLILLAAGFRKRVTEEIKWLGILSAAGLILIDVYYSLADVISNIYLLDAVGEFILIVLWLLAGRKGMAIVKEAEH
ncbi:hypothetical protein [Pontibacter ruber]|uniref:DUF4345 domain-containing protein n=1 Tax=Pontibacter ruber TaxID=1343895 RepID=A0ABW5CY50_9BACT|nr:hypothetical protein [Pontibacter ruber]